MAGGDVVFVQSRSTGRHGRRPGLVGRWLVKGREVLGSENGVEIIRIKEQMQEKPQRVMLICSGCQPWEREAADVWRVKSEKEWQKKE